MALMMVDAAGGTATPTAVVAGEATAAVLFGEDPGCPVAVSVESNPTPFVLRLTVTLNPPTF